MDVQLGRQQADDLDGADEERDGDGQAGDDQVVVDLTDRAGERPAVGEVHEAPVQGVEQGHPPGEQQRQGQDRVPRQALGGGRGGGGEQQDLGGSVEADPEDQPDEEHVPGLGDRAHEPAEEAPHHAAGLQLALELGLVEQARAQAAEHLEDPGQHDHVERRDQVQEAGCHRGADDPADGLVPGCGIDHGAEHRPGRDRQPDPDDDDDRGVPEREEEPGAERPLPVGHELAGGVVDRGDVIGVERVPGAQRPGGERDPDPEAQARVAEVVRLDREDEYPPAEHVEREDHESHPAEAAPFRGGQGVTRRAQAASRADCHLLHPPGGRRT